MTTVGIEFGGTLVTAVAVDERGQVMARATESSAGDPAAAARAVIRDVRSNGADGRAAGVTIPFHDDELSSAVSAVVAEETGAVPVAVKAGHALALGEAWCGAASGCQDVVAFAIGEHVTAGILISGRLLTGANGYAGSVAWLALNPVEREDYRRYGGLEAEVAAAGLVRRLVWRVKSGDHSQVVDGLRGELTRLTAEDVLSAARAGDGVCISVVRDTAKYVGMAVANLATVIDPECVVLGGTLASSGDLMADAIRAECSRRLRPAQSERIRVVLSTLGADAGAIGAARAARLERR
ncbi:MAG TPA: ROK family protein [Vicinamibacterales bacterium]|nr:ROK family protein [Vicinamibacterales bacterium]